MITADQPVQHQTTADNFATVGEIFSDGLSLIFDGASEPSKKHYKCNSAIRFSAGQRVKIARISGTYIVEYPIGFPT